MASAAFELPTSTKGYSDILAQNIDYAERYYEIVLQNYH